MPVPVTAESVKVFNHIKIASYACNLPTLAWYVVILVSMLRSNDRGNLIELIVVCLLMILSEIADVVLNQINYNYVERSFNRGMNNPYAWNQIQYACTFTTNTCFYLAHWIFAYSYLAMSI